MFCRKALRIPRSMCLIVLHLIHCLGEGPGCRMAPDPLFNGSLVNCANQRLTQSDLIKLPFHGVTTLDISYNNIDFVPDYAFERFKDLKRLMCTRCNLNGIGNFSLKGLDELEVLRLDRNHLAMYRRDEEQPTIPHGVFQYVPMLKELYIDNNGNYEKHVTSYSKYLDIFQYLPELTHLSIDSFRNLLIGKEFLSFSKLYSLRVSCGSMRSISDDSLKGFQNSTVKLFELTHGSSQQPFYRIGLNVFQYLPNISYLGLRNIRVGNQNALLMMKPLVGKKMDTIVFEAVCAPAFGNFKDKVSDTIVTVNDSIYGRNIILSNFFWYHSTVYSLEYDVPFSKVWQHNIKTVVFETDALTGTSILLLFNLMHLRELETIAYLWAGSGMRKQFDSAMNLISNWFEFPQRMNERTTIRQSKRVDVVSDERDVSLFDNIKTQISKFQSKNTNEKDILKTAQELSSHDGISTQHNILDFAQEILTTNLTLRLPPKLKTIIVDGAHYIYLNSQYSTFENVVESISLTNAVGVLQFHGKIHGLENVTSLNLQGSQQLDMGLTFLDSLPNLKNLSLRQTCVTPDFYQTNIRRVIEKLTALENFDLSENGLHRLPTDLFVTNSRLKRFVIASNRLSSMPFSLKLTPDLKVLDLRGNSFLDLSAEDRAAIDDHIVSVKNFTIFLGNNELACTCSKLPFIVWLKGRKHHFDMEGNYTCIAEGGTRSSTGAHMDIEVFWRRCRGSYYLMLSGILACSLVAVYLAIFLGMKKKTEIVSKVMQIVVPGFRLKTRRDYLFDVCIGYADQDGTYIREVLLRLLENKWHLSTFVHQRDLRQDPLEMSNALRDSWRNLLLVTEEFLYRYDMAHNVMKVASFFVSPSNPRSVVVMVEESVRHRIPDYVLQVVDEDNIIILPRLEQRLDYETKEFLRTRLT